ncbi:MAG: hypothetical protein KKC79_02440 [Gammaproteobacteria bacterium]|nr:hypothetical protein [Gammaproteobacteria bacterium]MBU1442415.1 hypothetical protein [Gammaproteobacteria bacterium]MBU2284843.1 hypothetical protein [Gammaproteobacteria bacterium]MBU2407490.1 hypothetical protein [Gammaproteobacteria bacterium]
MVDSHKPKTPDPAPPTDPFETRLGDRGAASGRNIEQDRAIGQGDPIEGSRMGGEKGTLDGFPDVPDSGTHPAQVEEAKRLAQKR